MKNKIRLLKRIVTFFFFVLFAFNSFATVVSDNDGSAFITKAEFDTLRNDFQTQVDAYNQSIDSKIDGAIAAYLSGIVLKQKTETPGYIPSIGNFGKNQEYLKFAYGGAMSISTANPKTTTMVNPNICIIGVYNYPKAAWQCITFLSHKPGIWGGQYENASAGVYLAGFEKFVDGTGTYLGLSDDYKIKKWQMQLAVQASGEHMSEGINSSITLGNEGKSWDFSNFLMPSADTLSFSANNKTYSCARSQANVIKDTQTLGVRNQAGNFYTQSGTGEIYGWASADFYVYYDGDTKTEESPINCYRRYLYNQGTGSAVDSSDKFSYIFKMPYNYSINYNDLINLGSSKTLGEHVYCYEGLPVVYCDRSTKTVSIPINVTNCGSVDATGYKAVICDEKFDNQKATSTSKNVIFKDTEWQSLGNRTININFSENKERILWIKLLPNPDTNVNVALKINLQNDKQITLVVDR